MDRATRHRSPRAYVTAAVVAVAFASGTLASAPGPTLAAAVSKPASIHFRVKNISVGAGSFQVAVDARIRTAWVAAGRLVRISEVTQRVSARIKAGAGLVFVAVDPGRRAVWTTCNSGFCPLMEVSETSNKVTHQVSGLGMVTGIAVDPRTGLVWIATVNAANQNVAVAVSETTRRVVHTVRLQFGAGHVVGAITADAGTRTVWVSGIPCGTCSGRDFVAEISEPAHRVVHVYGTPTRGISTSVVTAVASGTAWLASGMIREPGGTIQVVSIARHRVTRTIRTAEVAPEGIAIDTRTRTVVATGAAGPNVNTVVVLSESSGAQTGQLDVGFIPDLLAVDQGTGNVYVPIEFGKAVTEFHL